MEGEVKSSVIDIPSTRMKGEREFPDHPRTKHPGERKRYNEKKEKHHISAYTN
jgi:hypothetical protein